MPKLYTHQEAINYLINYTAYLEEARRFIKEGQDYIEEIPDVDQIDAFSNTLLQDIDTEINKLQGVYLKINKETKKLLGMGE